METGTKVCMQITVCVLLTMAFLLCSPFAGNAEVEIDHLSVEELLKLKDAIDSRLISLGAYQFVALERNDRGPDVLKLQSYLALLGYYHHEPSGKYDNNTQIAMKLFEKSAGLTPDGLASIEDQQTLFTTKIQPDPTSSVAPQSTATVTPDPVKSLYIHIDYDDYARYPDEYYLKKIFLKGRVEQVLGSRTDGFQIRLSVLNNTSNIIYVFINDDPGFNILEGDQLYVYARLNKTISYKSIWNQTIVIPAAISDFIELR